MKGKENGRGRGRRDGTRRKREKERTNDTVEKLTKFIE